MLDFRLHFLWRHPSQAPRNPLTFVSWIEFSVIFDELSSAAEIGSRGQEVRSRKELVRPEPASPDSNSACSHAYCGLSWDLMELRPNHETPSSPFQCLPNAFWRLGLSHLLMLQWPCLTEKSWSQNRAKGGILAMLQFPSYKAAT